MPRALLALAATAAAALSACAGLQSASAAATPVAEQASLHASFTPDRLEASTTISFSFHLQTATGLAPPPLTSVVLHMPAGMNYTLTTLGLAICQPAALQARRAEGLPAQLPHRLRQRARGSPVRHRLRP